MFKQEYKRLIKSKATIGIILVLTLLAVISFIVTYKAELDWVEMYKTDFSSTLNRDALANLIESYTGMKYMLEYWFNSDFAEITVYVLYIVVGIFVSPVLLNQRTSGFGNMVVSRKKYKTYLLSTLLAQSLYLCTVVFSSVLIEVVLAFIIGGIGTRGSLGGYDFGVTTFVVIVAVQAFILSIYAVLVSGIAATCSTFINNKYALQAFPLVAFALFPLISAQTLGNLSDVFAKIIVNFEAYAVMEGLSSVFNADFASSAIVELLLPIVTYVSILFVLIVVNIKKFSRDYI
ncbi:MAG: hypothetical protein IJW86_01440 [Clostridia bacterium]|nr:hypothetical protein [Clostridia bacterium]